jgi:hypothetical protein
MKPLMTEEPFTLFGHGVSVTGRKDTIVGRNERTREIVDYKVGKSEAGPCKSSCTSALLGRSQGKRRLLLRDGSERPGRLDGDLEPQVANAGERLRNPRGVSKMTVPCR